MAARKGTQKRGTADEMEHRAVLLPGWHQPGVVRSSEAAWGFTLAQSDDDENLWGFAPFSMEMKK